MCTTAVNADLESHRESRLLKTDDALTRSILNGTTAVYLTTIQRVRYGNLSWWCFGHRGGIRWIAKSPSYKARKSNRVRTLLSTANFVATRFGCVRECIRRVRYVRPRKPHEGRINPTESSGDVGTSNLMNFEDLSWSTRPREPSKTREHERPQSERTVLWQLTLREIWLV